MNRQEEKIAFFDSGVGGLSVFKKMKEILPNEDYLYFGDLKNSPYGEKSEDELVKISTRIFDYFKSQNVKAVVMACNTTSATAYEPLKDKYDFEIYPVIQSCAKQIASMDLRHLCVFATAATVNSHAYRKYITEYNSQIEVHELPCPDWVRLVEEDRVNTTECEESVKSHIDECLKFSPDKIVLGCTHYPFLTEVMKKYVDESRILNPANIFVEYIKRDLEEKTLLKQSSGGYEEFFVSANEEKFFHACKKFYELENLPQKILLV